MGRSSSSSSKKAAPSAAKPGILEKLGQLRQFLGDTSWSELDLENCLKECGWNVDLAAMRLMTGEYKQRKAGQKRGMSTFFSLTKASTPDPDSKKTRLSLGGSSNTLSKENQTAPKPTVSATTQRTPIQGTNLQEKNDYLLCERWLNGVSNRKGVKVSYKEILQVTSSQSGPPVIRFKGSSVEGTLEHNLCLMMAPLQRQGLIHLTAESMMEDLRIVMGTLVPMKLRVTISNPTAFFGLFDGDAADTGSARNTYFGNLGSKKKVLSVESVDLAESAFKLLQWAQYGDVPDFKQSETKLQATQATQEDSDDGELLDESAFETEDGKRPDTWAKDFIEASSKDPIADLPVMANPEGLQVTLRPYQGQALSWMWKRETDHGNRELVEKELMLLSELARNKAKSNSSYVDVYNVDEKEVSCECGPVVVSKEGAAKSSTVGGEINPVTHPLWQRRFLARDNLSSAVSFYVSELLGIASATPPRPPQLCVGGIEADSMGLGKTVMLLALLLKSKQEEKPTFPDEVYRTTLVVAPLSLISQWEEELASKTNLQYKVFYADSRIVVSKQSFCGVDVVLTTYGTLQGELYAINKKGKRNDGLLSHAWFRVILDEAHCIKNASTLCSKACCMLKAQRRWCLTGTPIQNSLEDVYALLKFLRHEPWCESGFWKAAITCVYNKNSGDADNQECIQVALDRVRRVLSPLILRRSKDTLDSKGEPILTLPPIEEKVVDVHLSVPEREFYNALKSKSQSIFEGIVNKGAFTKSYFQIFALLNRLRQCCDHVALTVKSLMDEDDWNSTEFGPSAKASLTPSKKNVKEDDFNQEFLEGLLQKFRSAHSVVNKENLPGKDYTITVATKISQVVSSRAEYFDDECAICLENPGIYDAAITPCAHVFCRDCLVNILVKAAAEINEVKQKNKEQSKPANTFFASCPDGECPCCKEQIQAKQVITLYRGQDGKTETKYLLETKFAVKSDDSSTDVARQTLENALKGEGSSKLAAILEELNKIWEQDPGSKVLIFSQFLGFLDLLQSALRKHKIPHGRLDGKLSLAERKYVVDQFKTDTADKRGSVLLMSMKAGGVGLNLVQASAVFIVDSWWNSAVEDQCVMRCHRIGQNAKLVRVRKFVVKHSVEERIIALQERKKNVAAKILNNDDNATELEDANKATLDDFKLLFGV